MTTERLTETAQNLKNTKATLKETKITLKDTTQDRNEQRFLVEEHVKTETQLYSQATEVGLIQSFSFMRHSRTLGKCVKMKITLRDTTQDRNEQRFLVEQHVKTETQLYSQATEVCCILSLCFKGCGNIEGLSYCVGQLRF